MRARLVVAILLCSSLVVASARSRDMAKPRIEVGLDLKTTTQEGRPVVVATVTVRNAGDSEASIQDLGNHQSVTFFCVDALGNIVQPAGAGKVNRPLQPDINLKPGESRSRDFVNLQFLSGSALFGYEFKNGGAYGVVALYRLNREGLGVASGEKRVEIVGNQQATPATATRR